MPVGRIRALPPNDSSRPLEESSHRMVWLALLRAALQVLWLLGCVATVFGFAFAAWLAMGVWAHWQHRPLPGARAAILVGGAVGWCLMATGYDFIDHGLLSVLGRWVGVPARFERSVGSGRRMRGSEDIGVLEATSGGFRFRGSRIVVRIRRSPNPESVVPNDDRWIAEDGSGHATPTRAFSGRFRIPD